MPSNLDRYEKDLDTLIEGGDLCLFLLRFLYDESFRKRVDKEEDLGKVQLKKLAKIKKANNLGPFEAFDECYQAFYSEAKELIRQLLPQRLADFVRYYERPKGRKAITLTTYSMEDCLQGVASQNAAPLNGVSLLQQQLAILKSAKHRFRSSLFEIKQLVQADLFDSEIDVARELVKNKFARAAGAVAGVVLEKHLSQVLDNHSLAIAKKNPGINDRTEILKNNNVIDMPTWRFIQHLADIRNLCDHDKKQEPTQEQALDLVDGVAKILKTLH